MSFTVPLTEAAWGKLVAWSALVLAGATLMVTLVYVLVLGLVDFSPFAELETGGRNPAAYRLDAAFDMLNWLGIGAMLLAFAGFFATRAPIRAVLLAACAVGQMVGAVGGALRLDAIIELAARYTSAGFDQQAVMGQVYLTLAKRWAPTTRLASCCMAPATCSLPASHFPTPVCRAGSRCLAPTLLSTNCRW